MADLFTQSTAVLSDCTKYRYRLVRIWDHTKPTLAWVMLNPSTADASVDDPTIKRCMGLANARGFGSIEVANLFGYRATNPNELHDVPDPIGPDNDMHIMALCIGRTTICGWGIGGKYLDRSLIVYKMLRELGVALHCFGTNKLGSPKHPLYLPDSVEMVEYSGDKL